MLLNFLLGLVWTLLPARVRQRHLSDWHGNLRTSAVVSGFVQVLGLLGIQIARYFHFMNYQLGLLAGTLVEKGAAGAVADQKVQFGLGFVSLVEFLIQPLTIMVGYFIFEGFVRGTAAFITGEVVGTLPLILIDKGAERLGRYREEKRQGPVLPDLVSAPPVEGSGYDLSVASCRAKPNWDHLMTISHQDTLYEVADYIEAAPPRRHVYLLRRAPANKVVRGLCNYHPEEIVEA